MKRKETLVLMEIVIMIGVFALAAGLCLRVFAFAGQQSAENRKLDRCVAEASGMAELLSFYDGDAEAAFAAYGGAAEQNPDGSWVIRYDEKWNITPDGTFCRMTVQPMATQSLYYGKAVITMTGSDGEVLFDIPAAWQIEEVRDE